MLLRRGHGAVRRRPGGEHLWGHGSDEGFGIKIGPGHLGLPSIDPDEVDRCIDPDTDIDPVASAIARAFPGLDPRPAKVITCMITDSPDGQFTVGRMGGDSRVVVVGGDSGHGFKHSAGLGELLAQIAAGEQPYCDASFLDPARLR